MRRTTSGSARALGLAGLVVASLTLATAGCASHDPFGPERAELARAERLWDGQGPADYEYVFTPSCFCPYTPRRVTVRGGQVVNVVLVDEGAMDTGPAGVEGYTMEELLDRVREELERQPYRARLEFDADLGYPLDVWFDYEELAVDEEWGFAVTEFQPLD